MGSGVLYFNFNKEEKTASQSRIAVNSEIKFQHSRELEAGDMIQGKGEEYSKDN